MGRFITGKPTIGQGKERKGKERKAQPGEEYRRGDGEGDQLFRAPTPDADFDEGE
jgi:hypothetical protein